jgi:transposase
MPATPNTKRQKRALTVERVAPALIPLAQGAYAREAAEPAGVSIATVLNWMDWAWRHRDQVEVYLREHYPDLSAEELAYLWKRIERRRAKRQRRRDFTDWRSNG